MQFQEECMVVDIMINSSLLSPNSVDVPDDHPPNIHLPHLSQCWSLRAVSICFLTASFDAEQFDRISTRRRVVIHIVLLRKNLEEAND